MKNRMQNAGELGMHRPLPLIMQNATKDLFHVFHEIPRILGMTNRMQNGGKAKTKEN